MHGRFAVAEAPRVVPSGTASDVPLVTLAWRALRADHLHRAEERRRAETETRRLLDALADVAEQAHRLGQLARVADILQRGGLTVLAPVGERFDDEWMDLFDNVAQREDASIEAPTVAEVIVPAVVYDGGVLRRGKAVIALPAAAAGM